MNFLIAPNSFKECDDSVGIASLFYKNLKQKLEGNFICVPISDGGDGFLTVCENIFDLRRISYSVSKPYSEDIFNCDVGYDSKNNNLFIESASVLGMKIIPKNQRRPGKINSKGLGELLQKVTQDVVQKKLNVKKVFIGIGGTGTNDLGLGMASVFGLKLFDHENEIKVEPLKFSNASRIAWSKRKSPFKIISVIDVKNKLLGKNGAVYTFAKQKGANESELSVLEKGFSNVINLLAKRKLIKGKNALSGAGGGLAAGLKIFFNSEVISSSDFIMNQLGIKNIKKKINYVVTGEGAFDSQSLMEKGAGILIDYYKNSAKIIYLCCGKIDSKVVKKLPSNVYPIEFVRYFKNEKDSIKKYKTAIKLASNEIAKHVNVSVY
jgi:glycerate 2-kinase